MRENKKDTLNRLTFYLEDSSNILNLGYGDGVDAKYFSDKGFNISAIDISQVAIDNLKDINIDVKVYDIKNKLKDGGCLYITSKTQSFQDKIKTGKQFLHKKEWIKILNYYFQDIRITEHSGKLYNKYCQWLEIECYKINDVSI
ncbi:MAG: methyltransferase domain-containing protein [Ignavibacteria bacterium]|nr:methyltransferase domain-containing protein [Ignavibacteria bacterium]